MTLSCIFSCIMQSVQQLEDIIAFKHLKQFSITKRNKRINYHSAIRVRNEQEYNHYDIMYLILNS